MQKELMVLLVSKYPEREKVVTSTYLCVHRNIIDGIVVSQSLLEECVVDVPRVRVHIRVAHISKKAKECHRLVLNGIKFSNFNAGCTWRI